MSSTEKQPPETQVDRSEVDVEQPVINEKVTQQIERPKRQATLERFINLPSVISFEVIVQAAWESISLTFQFSLLNGGPASLVYGGIFAGFGATAVAASLAEMASIDAAVGAQYRWSAEFAPFAPRFWGLVQGWITVSAWIFASVSAPAILSNMVTALMIFNNESYAPERWHTALFTWLFILVPVVFNLWLRKLLNPFETIGGIFHVVFFFVNIITLAVLAKRSTGDYVFKTLTHDVSGWTNPAVAWGLGLLTVVFPVSGSDGALHMSDEVKSAQSRVPYAIIVSTLSNSVMQWAYIICLLYTVGDLDKVTNSPTGLPIIEVYYQATKSKAATNILVLASGLVILVAVFNTYASVSRLTWAFARDNGLPFSRTFSYINPRFKMPLNTLVLIASICFALSLIYIGSSTAFNAIISLVTIGLQVSYVIPILFILLRKIRGPPIKYGPFSLRRWGIPINLFALAYLVFVIIWIPFPSMLPVTKLNMNYSGPVFAVFILAALVDWTISGRKRFKVPTLQQNPDF